MVGIYRRKNRARPAVAHINSGAGLPNDNDNLPDGAEWTALAPPYAGIVWRKGWITPGHYDVHSAPLDYFFGRRTDLQNTFRNPLLYADIDGRNPFSLFPANTSLHFRDSLGISGADLQLTALTGAGALHPDGSLGYGRTDVGDGRQGWLLHSFQIGNNPGTNGDEASHAGSPLLVTGARRCEESLPATISQDDIDVYAIEKWQFCNARNGVGNLRYPRAGADLVDLLLWQLPHDNGMPGGMAPMAALSYQHMADGSQWRSIQVNSPTWVGGKGTGSVSTTTLTIAGVTGVLAVGRQITVNGNLSGLGVVLSGSRFQGSVNASTMVMTVTSPTASLIVGQPVRDSGGLLPAGVTIQSQLTGSAGGAGTYQLTGATGVAVATTTMYSYGDGTGTYTGSGKDGTYLLSGSATVAGGSTIAVGQYSDNYSTQNFWLGSDGQSQTMTGGRTGTFQPSSSFVPVDQAHEQRERFRIKVRWSPVPGVALLKVWWGAGNNPLQLVCNTTIANMFDPAAIGHSTSNVLYYKGGYLPNHGDGSDAPGNSYKIEFAKRSQRILNNGTLPQAYQVLVNSIQAYGQDYFGSTDTSDDAIAAYWDAIP